jgi:hypothetical protein
MQEAETKTSPPIWYSEIDFGKMDVFLKSGEGKKIVGETMTTTTDAEKAINEMTLVHPKKILEPYTI